MTRRWRAQKALAGVSGRGKGVRRVSGASERVVPGKAVKGTLATTAIPTVWDGVLMRSRLEARWAEVLDRLGIEWEYEPVKLVVGTGRERVGYIPDFYLPRLRAWVEVKGPHWERFEKTRALAKQEGTDGLVLVATASGISWRVPPSGRPADSEVWAGRCRCGVTALGLSRKGGWIGCRACGRSVRRMCVLGW